MSRGYEWGAPTGNSEVLPQEEGVGRLRERSGKRTGTEPVRTSLLGERWPETGKPEALFFFLSRVRAGAFPSFLAQLRARPLLGLGTHFLEARPFCHFRLCLPSSGLLPLLSLFVAMVSGM